MITHTTQLKVRSYECDIYGHVNNATFLNYCEYARVEFLNTLGYDLASLKEKGFILPIVKIEIEYKFPAFQGDLLNLELKWIERGRSSSTFEQNIVHQKNSKVAARALVTWVVTNLEGKPISMPDELMHSVQAIYHELPPKKSPQKEAENVSR